MIQSVRRVFQQDQVLLIAAVAALLSMLIVPPSKNYLSYIDFSVLSLLFCLMAVVSGFRETGVFSHLSCLLLKQVQQTRSLAAVLIGLCFFSAMLITNDVALLTFIPLTLGLLHNTEKRFMIITVVLQTIAANLGSLITPVGNPQNLYLYTYYDMSLVSFLQLTLPLGGVCLVLLGISLFCIPQKPLSIPQEQLTVQALPIGPTFGYSLLFLLCLGTVVGMVSHLICFLIVLVYLLLIRPTLFRRIDYGLLATFVCFFVFVGNLTQISALHNWIASGLSEHVFLYSILASQIISNVPAAVLLSGFTNQASALVLGTDIGGLGTLIASLASLISYRLYCQAESADPTTYLRSFSLFNLLFLLLLVPFGYFLLT